MYKYRIKSIITKWGIKRVLIGKADKFYLERQMSGTCTIWVNQDNPLTNCQVLFSCIDIRSGVWI